MTLIIALPIIAALLLAWAYAFAQRIQTMSIRSIRHWDEARRAAERIIADDDMPDPIVSFVYAVAMSTGCGCYALMMFVDVLRGRLAGAVKRESSDGEFARAMRGLSDEQRSLVARFMAAALFYDTFHVPLPGVGLIVRRSLWWLAPTSEQSSSVSAEQLKVVTISAKHAAEKEARRHPLEAVCVLA